MLQTRTVAMARPPLALLASLTRPRHVTYLKFEN